jgi:hypothetical protein
LGCGSFTFFCIPPSILATHLSMVWVYMGGINIIT